MHVKACLVIISILPANIFNMVHKKSEFRLPKRLFLKKSIYNHYNCRLRQRRHTEPFLEILLDFKIFPSICDIPPNSVKPYYSYNYLRKIM